MAKPKLVEIEWVDARSKYEELGLTEAVAKCALVRRHSVGYLVLKDRDRVLICHTYDPAETEQDIEGGCDWTVIPKGWVKSIIELNPSTATTPPESEVP